MGTRGNMGDRVNVGRKISTYVSKVFYDKSSGKGVLDKGWILYHAMLTLAMDMIDRFLYFK